jgi:hypothetical protein
VKLLVVLCARPKLQAAERLKCGAHISELRNSRWISAMNRHMILSRRVVRDTPGIHRRRTQLSMALTIAERTEDSPAEAVPGISPLGNIVRPCPAMAYTLAFHLTSLGP